jgi:serine/threonine protein kinase
MNGERKKADIAFQKGQQIGQYRVMSTLDRGRFAGAYLCQHLQHGTQVIVDVLRPPLMGELKEDFLAQTKMLMALDHPQILRLQDAGVEGHYPFLVTEYIPHLTLREAYPEGKPHSLAKILPYLKQIASALQYAHERNVLHEDIRLENILLNRSNQILLWGFTIEAIRQNRERLQYHKSGDMRNSIAYSAPERIQGKAIPASDQYSLAIIVYELLCGALPFTGSYLEIANQQVNTPPTSMLQKAPGISLKVENVVMKALAKDPQQRFATIQAFIDTLEQEQTAKPRIATARKTVPPAQPTGVIAPPVIQSQPAKSPAPTAHISFSPNPPGQTPAFASKPPPSLRTAPPQTSPPPAPVAIVVQHPTPPSLSPTPVAAMQTSQAPLESAPIAPRRGNNSMTRRVFAVGLVGVAVLGGAGGWYMLSKRLAVPASPSVTSNDSPPATPTSVNNQSALIFTGHLAAVNAVAWSPDGKRIASASDDKFVQIFEASSGKRIVIYSGHTEEVAAVAWSPNNKLIASGGQDGTAQVWDAVSGKQIFTYKGHHDRVNALSWSKESQQLASGSEDKTVQVWNAMNGSQTFNFQGHTATR